MQTFKSSVSGAEFPITDRVPGSVIRDTIMSVIKRDHPQFDDDSFIAASELNHYRKKYISEYLTEQSGQLTDAEKEVVSAVAGKTTLTDKVDTESDELLTLGQRVADRVAGFGGSWTFILSFMGFLVIWIAVNVWWFSHRAFDPYPFILLNLILSCIAALQAPVIMMSQNRQEEKDRERARKDYMVNLKSELEIRMLHEKLDHLISEQQVMRDQVEAFAQKPGAATAGK